MLTNPDRRASAELLTMVVHGVPVARYVDGAGVAPGLSPRPYLHPVRTPAGTVVTEAAAPDHPWHLGAGVALQDASGTNLWGDRTYVHGHGYVWRANHGRIVHDGWLDRGDGRAREALRWLDPGGSPVLAEVRELRWGPAGASDRWELALAFTLTAPADAGVRLASPRANGRPDGGYGGFFWRLPDSRDVSVRGPAGEGVDAVHDRPAPWLTWSARTAAGAPYHLTFQPDDEATAGDRWFVRVRGYPGIGSSLAAEPVALPPGGSLTRRFRVLIGDGPAPGGGPA